MSKQILVFMGTRPEGIKMAPVVRAAMASTLTPVVVNTGQHREMLDQVLDLFEVPVTHSLQVMRPNQTLAGVTARLIQSIDAVLDETPADFALVQGDTTTVLAASLACFYRGIPVGHVEAGLRSHDLRAPFPEEANRLLAGKLADLHFAPTTQSEANLLREHVSPEQIHVTGNTVIDALHLEVNRQSEPAVRNELLQRLNAHLPAGWEEQPFVLVTGHRRENFGDGFVSICDALKTLAERFPETRFIYPVHLNPNVKGPVEERLGPYTNISLIPPQPYSEFVTLLQRCNLVLTDSGGVQEEAPGLGKPVLVMRDVTERPEGVAAGTVTLVGPNRDRIVDEVSRLLTDPDAYARMAQATNPYGDGKAAPRIIAAVEKWLENAQ